MSHKMCTLIIIVLSVTSSIEATLNVGYVDLVCRRNTTDYKNVYSDVCKPYLCTDNCSSDTSCPASVGFETGAAKCVHQSSFSDRSTMELDSFPQTLRTAYYVVAKCPPDADQSERNECELEQTQEAVQYVSGVKSHRIYKNEMCAWCNGVNEFVKWRSAVYIRQEDSPKWFNDIRNDQDVVKELKNKLIFSIPPVGYPNGLNECALDDIHTCNQSGNWDVFDKNIEWLCRLPELSSVYIFRKSYRNVYCCLCNYPNFGPRPSKCLYNINPAKTTDSYFKLISWHEEDISDHKTSITEMRCSGHQMLDPLEEACVDIICPFGRFPLAGSCKKRLFSISTLVVYFRFEMHLLSSNEVDSFTLMRSLRNNLLLSGCEIGMINVVSVVGEDERFMCDVLISTTARCDTDYLAETLKRFEDKYSDNQTFITNDNRELYASVTFDFAYEQVNIPPLFLNDDALHQKYYCPAIVISSDNIDKIHDSGLINTTTFNKVSELFLNSSGKIPHAGPAITGTLVEVSESFLNRSHAPSGSPNKSRIICISDYMQLVADTNGGITICSLSVGVTLYMFLMQGMLLRIV